jgi:hypothetical protein
VTMPPHSSAKSAAINPQTEQVAEAVYLEAERFMTTAGSSMRRWQKNRNVSLEVLCRAKELSRDGYHNFMSIQCRRLVMSGRCRLRLCGSRISHYVPQKSPPETR